MKSFENDTEMCEISNPYAFLVFLMDPAGETIFIKTHSTENRCHMTGKHTVCRRVRASFSPENLQAGAVKGLIARYSFGTMVVCVHQSIQDKMLKSEAIPSQ